MRRPGQAPRRASKKKTNDRCVEKRKTNCRRVEKKRGTTPRSKPKKEFAFPAVHYKEDENALTKIGTMKVKHFITTITNINYVAGRWMKYGVTSTYVPFIIV
jgi:hypothetical protein